MKGSIIRRQGKHGVAYLLKYEAGPDPATGKRRQRYHTVNGTKADAQKKLRELLGAVDNGTDVDPSRVTVAEWVETWLQDHAAASVSPRTLERYSELLRLHVVPRIGAVRLQALRAPTIQAMYTALRTSGKKAPKEGGEPTGLAGLTLRHIHRVFALCLKVAASQQAIVRNPMQDVTAPTVKGRNGAEGEEGAQVPALDAAQLDKLLKAIKGRALFPFAALAAGTGARRGELLALRWSDIDFDAATLRIERSVEETKAHGVVIKPTPKNHSSRRTIALDRGTVGMLRAERTRQRELSLKIGHRLPGDALVFAPSVLEPTKPRDPRAVTKDFGRLATAAGFPSTTVHHLRHTHATLLLLAGVPADAVAKRLGHSSPVTTMTIYSHVLKRAEDKAADVAGELLRSALAQD